MNNEEDKLGPNITRRESLKLTLGAVAALATSASILPQIADALANEETYSGKVPITAGMTVGQYLLERLKKLGVTHTFGVPGDYIYDVCDAIEDDPELQGVWNANELNGYYAANGSARAQNTIGVAVFTMQAELSALQAMADANIEQVPVLHIVGLPSIKEMNASTRGHHMLAGMEDNNYDLYNKMTAPLTAGGNANTVITPENCVEEIERVIAAMLYYSKPGIISVPRNVAQQPVVIPRGDLNTPLEDPQSDPKALDAAVQNILALINKAKRPVWVPGYALRRFDCLDIAQAVIEKSGLPFFTALQDVTVLPQSHPQYGGNYLGRWEGIADMDLAKYVEESDCVIGIGPENHSMNNGIHTVKDTLEDTMNIMPHQTRIGFTVYKNVNMKDILTELAKRIKTRSVDTPPPVVKNLFSKKLQGAATDEITYDPFYQRLQAFLKPNDILVGDTSMTNIGFAYRARFPEGAHYEAAVASGMLGFGTPTSLGCALTGEGRRTVLLTGDGAHQMTANEVGSFYRYGAKPVIIVVNNEGYGAERATNRYPDAAYNSVSGWNYADLPATLGCKDWFTAKVTTIGELDQALATASNSNVGVYLEVIIDKDEMPGGGDFMFGLTGNNFGLGGRTWEGWLLHGRKLKV